MEVTRKVRVAGLLPSVFKVVLGMHYVPIVLRSFASNVFAVSFTTFYMYGRACMSKKMELFVIAQLS